jgi:hypothetical protein
MFGNFFSCGAKDRAVGIGVISKKLRIGATQKAIFLSDIKNFHFVRNRYQLETGHIAFFWSRPWVHQPQQSGITEFPGSFKILLRRKIFCGWKDAVAD